MLEVKGLVLGFDLTVEPNHSQYLDTLATRKYLCITFCLQGVMFEKPSGILDQKENYVYIVERPPKTLGSL